jgi:hypothetical protein
MATMGLSAEWVAWQMRTGVTPCPFAPPECSFPWPSEFGFGVPCAPPDARAIPIVPETRPAARARTSHLRTVMSSSLLPSPQWGTPFWTNRRKERKVFVRLEGNNQVRRSEALWLVLRDQRHLDLERDARSTESERLLRDL